MSSPSNDTPRRRAPMFYCHECGAEMRPLMVPDPHCAACNGTFVEELPEDDTPDHSNPDDPRNFQQDGFGPFHDHGGGGGEGPTVLGGGDPVIQLMNLLMMGGLQPPPGRSGGGGSTIRFDMNGGRGRVVFTSGGGGPLADIVPGPAGGSPRRNPAMPPHPLEGLFALLAGGPGLGGVAGGPGGQFGDYVLDQNSLDEIITRLMEQSQGARPVPAPDDMIAKLPRKQVVAGDPLTEKECAVCKDTFEPSQGDEEVVTLPCSDNPKYQHTFHEECIVPWLKENGTCPVCRHQLVPQPEHHGPAPTSPQGGPPPPRSPNAGGGSSGSPTNPGGSGFSGFWEMITGAANRNETSNGQSSSSSSHQQQRPSSPRHSNSNSGARSPNNRGNGNGNVPGSWDALD